ncbi:hypothetical protein D3C87_1973450 [compost metagenome]
MRSIGVEVHVEDIGEVGSTDFETYSLAVRLSIGVGDDPGNQTAFLVHAIRGCADPFLIGDNPVAGGYQLEKVGAEGLRLFSA